MKRRRAAGMLMPPIDGASIARRRDRRWKTRGRAVDKAARPFAVHEQPHIVTESGRSARRPAAGQAAPAAAADSPPCGPAGAGPTGGEPCQLPLPRRLKLFVRVTV